MSKGDDISTGTWDAVVIGSGLGGLTSAAYLSAAGKRVLLLERYDVLGGSSHVFRRQRKWEFDVGVHYIGDCGPGGLVPDIMRGLSLDDRIEWLPLDGKAIDTMLAPGFRMDFPHGWDQFQSNLLQAFPDERKAITRYCTTLRRIGEGVDVNAALGSRRGVLAQARRMGPTTSAVAMMPLGAFQLACGLSARAILANSAHLGAIATTADSAPVMAHAGLMEHFVGRGGYFPRGGGQILAAGFAEVITSHGGTIRTGVGVTKIVIDAGRVTGLRLSTGEQIRTPVVVSNVDIKRTYNDLVGLEHLPIRTRLQVKSWKMANPLINAFFGIEYDVSSAPNSNHFVIPTWDIAADMAALARFRAQVTMGWNRDPLDWARDYAAQMPAYVQTSTRRDPSNTHSAPPGHAAFEAQSIAPSSPRLWGLTPDEAESGSYRKNPRYREIKKIITDGMLARIETAYPGAADHVEWAELATPMTQTRYTGGTAGNAMGLEPRIGQFGIGRPRSTTHVPGLFLAGTSTAWGPGTQGSMLSGVRAAGEILGRDLVAEVRGGTVIADPARLNPWSADFDPLAATRMLGRDRKHLARTSTDALDE